MLFIRAGIHKMLVRTANTIDPDQTLVKKQSDLGLCCLCMPFGQTLNILEHLLYIKVSFLGVQWLSGRVLDSRPRDRGFEPHQRHCLVSLSKKINPSLVLVQPRRTHPFITEILLMGLKESNQTNKTIPFCILL